MVQQTRFAVVNKFTVSPRLSIFLRILFFALVVAASGVFFAVTAMPQAQTQPSAAKQATRKKHKLRVTKGYITAVSLKADKAKMSDIAEDLAKRLGTQVILGPSLKKKVITVEFYDLPLEPALGLLATRTYIDYEIRANAPPSPLAIYLVDLDDPDPALDAVVQGSSEAMLIEGNTEDPGEESAAKAADDPLQVELEDTQLTIKSKKQPLAAVVLTVAEVLGVPAEVKYDSDEIVDTEIKDTPFEDAITRLSPNIRLYVRADLARSHRTPLRIKVVPPAKVTDSAMKQ
ncbi:MAG TPA: hypothetical protein VIF64_12900 [Pyrinomonadaceae bacterium]|jgi:hypothetical protein